MTIASFLVRALAAACLALSPLLLMLLPAVLAPAAGYTSAEEQLFALADGPAPYGWLLAQAVGAVLLVPAAVVVLGAALHRRRGVVFGVLGAVAATSAAFALVLLLGMELGQAFLLQTAADTEAAVRSALALQEWGFFSLLLGVGLAGTFLSGPLLAVTLWRARVSPALLPALFVVPVAIGFLPVGAVAANLLPAGILVGLGAWMAVLLIRSGHPVDVASATRDGAGSHAPV